VTSIAFFTDVANELGESPLWDPRSDWLWWVDICRNRILAADAAGEIMRAWDYDSPVCAIGLAPDGLFAAFSDHFALIGPDGSARRIAAPPIGVGAIRFNDGKADRQGRFLCGTMQHGGQDEALAAVWQIDPAGRVRQVEQGLRLTNSICFSPCGRWLFLADSLDAVIRRYPYDPATGDLGAASRFFDCAAIGAIPDGATVDSEGRLWVALVTSAQIACISPSGALLRRIDVPVPFPTCPAFGGPGLGTLYLTSIADSGHKLKSDAPEAGRTLAIAGLDARGLAEAVCPFDNHTWN